MLDFARAIPTRGLPRANTPKRIANGTMRPFLAVLNEIPTHAGPKASSTNCPICYFSQCLPWSPAAIPSAPSIDCSVMQSGGMAAEHPLDGLWIEILKDVADRGMGGRTLPVAGRRRRSAGDGAP
jgi:hypothetical protein